MVADAQPDLLAPLEPAPQQEGPEPGEIRGDLEAAAAAASGLEVWCGQRHGWRAFGPIIMGAGRITVVWHRGRLMGGLHFDLGETS